MNLELKNPSFHKRLAALIGQEKPFSWAVRVGLSRGAFSRVWNEGTIPSSDGLIKIQEATNVDLNWLLTGEGSMYMGEENTGHSYINDPAAHYVAKDGKAMPVIDEELLIDAIEAVDLENAEKKLGWSARKKAETVCFLYVNEKRKEKTVKGKLGKMLKLFRSG